MFFYSKKTTSFEFVCFFCPFRRSWRFCVLLLATLVSKRNKAQQLLVLRSSNEARVEAKWRCKVLRLNRGGGEKSWFVKFLVYLVVVVAAAVFLFFSFFYKISGFSSDFLGI